MVAGRVEDETDLVEREREVRALEALLEGALAGDGRVALIEGPAGIGKSRLLQLVRRRGEAASALTLSARSSELEREFPYGVVRQLFEGVLADPAVRERALAGAAAAARPVFESLEPEPPGEAGAASFATLHGLYWLMVNLAADRPLVLAVDDLHWCDRPSLRFLAYVTRRLDGLPVLLGVTLRTTDPGSDPALMSEIANDLASTALRPGPLTDAAVRSLVRTALGGEAADAFCAAVHAATGGNPLLVRQLLRALEAEGVRGDAASAGIVREIGPAAVARTVLVRLARQPPEALAIARPSRCSARERALPPWPRSPRSTSRRSPVRRARSRAPRSSVPSRRSASSTRWSAMRSTASCRTRSARCGTSARSPCCETSARPRRRSPRSC
jgi:AAA ATPase domain